MITLVAIMGACGSGQEDQPALPQYEDDGIRSESYGVRYMFTDSSRLQAQMQSGHVIEKEEKEDDEDAKPETVFYLEDSVKIDFYNIRERPQSEVSSQKGIYWESRKLAKLTGEVVLINKAGDKLETEELFWDEDREKIYTEKYVRVQTADKIITSDSGLVSNTSFTEYEFKGNITAEYEYEENEF